MSLAVDASRGTGFQDDDEPFIPGPEIASYAGIRLPDGRTLAWREYGNPRGVPCLLIPDARSSRLAPTWMLHDTALPDGIRLIAVDRPGTGYSDPIGFGGIEDLADDLARVVETLAVGSVVMIGVGYGADAALTFADRRPGMVAAAMAISVRTAVDAPETRGLLNPFSRRHIAPWTGPLDAWARAAGRGDLHESRVWERATQRMEPLAARVIGDRWRHSDFRSAVAADLAQTPAHWVHTETYSEPEWVHNWSSRTPVHCWHGREESATHVSSVRAIAENRPNWRVTPVPGAGALLGAWPEILRDARTSYLRTLVR
ncbi:alpha/beta fold hydrolase [Nakamurella lactea]|uniref:alpha/beta fold hydrolase n=1 Tax=Nakamurella lactea TaxID=459515 RepID=UPI000420B621|nr:alpha/beta fold hydrolase [Nakamurella lactea]